MKRLLVSIIVGAIVFLNLIVASPANASPSNMLGMPNFYLADTSAPLTKDFITQLETEIIPQLEKIFTPEQKEQFQTEIANGKTFRKAFKSLTLTLDQKMQLKTLLKSVSKKDAFASLTPEQKKQIFLKKKEMMMPTTEEITDKITAGFKGKGTDLPEGVKEKIEAGIKKKEAFMPTPETIGEKIKAGKKED
ncbi:hypothetical protein ACE1CI_10680 [Aerosakkonemataceae cyanobacterium BLCC-F50]|uniref:LTXXQ motif protein n=1 Tax=Floridaenema flaviceps BLCC-F50 TaxID=3153642 RepID=A0ABV4XPI6_9CYAN